MVSFTPVEALVRGLEVLRIVNKEREASVAAIHKATRLNKATIVRMLETLSSEGYITRAEDRAAYVPTARSLLLSAGYDHHQGFVSVVEPILGEFRARIGWPSDVAVCDRDAMLIVQTTRMHGPLSLNRHPGFRAPMLATALGRAYLAFCGDSELQAICARLAASPDEGNELARQPLQLQTIIDETRHRGFALTSESYITRVFNDMMWAMAVPIADKHEIFGTIDIVMIRQVVGLEDATSRYLPLLQETAAELATALSTRRSDV